ncbi:MAG: DUF5684 domain-containing protein [Phycisphaeraceae bacterium]
MFNVFESLASTLAQGGSSMPSSGGGEGGSIVAGLIWLALLVLFIAGWWKTLSKAGQPGWTAIIPIVQLYFLLKVAGRPGWWLILFLIPLVNFIISIIVYNDVSKSFGRGVGTTIGLVFLPFVFFPILGFGSAEYQGPAGAGEVGGPTVD